MSDVTGDLAAVSEAKGGSDAARISEVKAWLTSQFEAAGKEVPNFEYTHRSITHLYNLATASQAKSQAATIVANDFRLKASEYRAQAARIREILESAGMSQESLPSNVVSSAQVLANVANLLNIRDTELSSFLVAMGDISLRKTGVEEKRAKAQKESNALLDYTRKAIQRLTYLKKILAQLEDDVVPCESQMENWKTNLEVMAVKEEQYIQQYKKYEQMLLNRVGYTPKISHRELVEMAEHRKELDKMTKPVLDTLRSYQDLPPDKALAALAIEDKKRQFAASEKYLEEVLQSALETNNE
ncbi:AUGMIN subunit 1 isoform X1 [Arabidopsis lyrata subsp. lyrata]|uniref:AUGMIN subunit 1 isoform X1 n=1 Tax=Arabidopsis lyrata subsp. lyrata TaxID=81972 RepID=UPI000A29D19B|nr:AUGMIN subunit 1 isoform X1 [Arabidopsis lyrata subsp. lyrata]|eukprot:XP_020884809.1 AUGMIN subunit 1 isoform X1 [Arabidopsis lyrata subsp. lyrata]